MARETLLKIRIWAKLTLLGVVVVYCLLFALMNHREVELWLFFGLRPQTSLLVAVLGAFVLGALLTLIVRTFLGTIRQMREQRERDRTARLEREIADMRTKAGGLRSREERPAAAPRKQ